MNTVLIISQIFFYTTASLSIVCVSIFFIFFVSNIIKILKGFEKIISNINETSEDVIEKINYIIEKFSDLPMISYFLNKKSKTIKGRKKSI